MNIRKRRIISSSCTWVQPPSSLHWAQSCGRSSSNWYISFSISMRCKVWGPYDDWRLWGSQPPDRGLSLNTGGISPLDRLSSTSRPGPAIKPENHKSSILTARSEGEDGRRRRYYKCHTVMVKTFQNHKKLKSVLIRQSRNHRLVYRPLSFSPTLSIFQKCFINTWWLEFISILNK